MWAVGAKYFLNFVQDFIWLLIIVFITLIVFMILIISHSLSINLSAFYQMCVIVFRPKRHLKNIIILLLKGILISEFLLLWLLCKNSFFISFILKSILEKGSKRTLNISKIDVHAPPKSFKTSTMLYTYLVLVVWNEVNCIFSI
jgi:hypothetical protein